MMRATLWRLAFLNALMLTVGSNQTWAHGDEDHSKKPSATAVKKTNGSQVEAAAATRLPDGSVFVPKLVQRQLQLRTIVAEVDQYATSLELNGKVVADPNAGGKVQASQAGRIEVTSQSLPVLGQRVSKGQVLAYLRPVMSSLDRGNSQSILADLDAQLSIAEKKVQRYEALAEALPKAVVEAARYDYEALRKRKAAVEASLSKTEALIAPVSGVISVANAVAGQVVDARETLLEIIDPSRLMVEALAYEPLNANEVIGATASWKNAGVVSTKLDLKFLGGGQQMREQAIPLLFRVLTDQRSKSQNVAVGQSLQVFVQQKRDSEGVAVPLSAIVKVGTGQSAVWVHTEAERFVQKQVKLQALDAERVLILSGVEEGARILVSGAHLLAQVK
ncbi:efflux RND transporter periplasmic adaptor subunit [Undibacterium cyanobacteriorum]|uniref:Efflux RND transporter periplasmic adaptor subunit n=1 Tax=Undibacterium cyanobacteriorum TaxID=3073561 RepID=A0ABY9RLE6_9BURK|nr:HlyD family efflux transporter periplasmic adaptor subunit [Undibacterium sp. 20NA77.5]WMW81688.1 efflux RND transporter periplasmic adaptor subunit [Undibacterium sp. 20NA77.5]